MADQYLVKVRVLEDLQDHGEENEALVPRELVRQAPPRASRDPIQDHKADPTNPTAKRQWATLSSMITVSQSSLSMIGMAIHYLKKMLVKMPVLESIRNCNRDRDER